jgi:hypothetical protein
VQVLFYHGHGSIQHSHHCLQTAAPTYGFTACVFRLVGLWGKAYLQLRLEMIGGIQERFSIENYFPIKRLWSCWFIMACSSIVVNRRFGGAYCLHLRDPHIKPSKEMIRNVSTFLQNVNGLGLHGVRPQNNTICLSAVNINLAYVSQIHFSISHSESRKQFNCVKSLNTEYSSLSPLQTISELFSICTTFTELNLNKTHRPSYKM